MICPSERGPPSRGQSLINRVDLAVEVDEREAPALDLHTDHAGFGNIRLLGDFDEPAHLLVLPENGIHSLRCRPDTTTVIHW